MTTKQYLNQIDKYNKIINNKLSEIYQLKTMICSISLLTDTDKVQTSSDKDKLGSTVAKIVDLENEIDKIIDGFIEKRTRIIFQIDSMENAVHYQILFSRYIEQKTFERIAEVTGYSVRQVLRLHNNAIKTFENKYGAEYLK